MFYMRMKYNNREERDDKRDQKLQWKFKLTKKQINRLVIDDYNFFYIVVKRLSAYEIIPLCKLPTLTGLYNSIHVHLQH
jgi:hypothetical protein